jgi:hypothetical protein
MRGLRAATDADKDVSSERLAQVLSELKTAKPPVPIKLVTARK